MAMSAGVDDEAERAVLARDVIVVGHRSLPPTTTDRIAPYRSRCFARKRPAGISYLNTTLTLNSRLYI
jgi:hypothetical protein